MNISYIDYKTYSYKGTPQVYFDAFYRKISHPISFVLVRCGATPMLISVLSFFFAIFAGIFFVFQYPFLGIGCFVISYLFDFCDGNVARVFIKTVGLTDTQQKQGELIETLNTNISLVAMYVGIGMLCTKMYMSPYYLLYAAVVLGIKLSSRYLVRTAYDTFRGNQQSVRPGAEFMKRYQSSSFIKMKFFFTKSFFSANFYYIIYLFAFLTPHVAIIFILYAGADCLFQLMRAIHVFIRTSRITS